MSRESCLFASSDVNLFKRGGRTANKLRNGANSYLVNTIEFDDFLDLLKKTGKYWLTLNVHAPLEKVNYFLINSRVEKGRI